MRFTRASACRTHSTGHPKTASAHRPSLPRGQFFRYLCVGVFNTFFGYINFAVILTLLNTVLPVRFLYLTVVLASILSVPLNITVAYLSYKFFVFRTKGNYLGEWFKCFAVYGTGMIPGLVALSALTRFLQVADSQPRSLASPSSQCRGTPSERPSTRVSSAHRDRQGYGRLYCWRARHGNLHHLRLRRPQDVYLSTKKVALTKPLS